MIEFTDRYETLGIPYPEHDTMCLGQCEGTWVPVARDDMEEPYRTLWLEAEKKEPSNDGWHFVRCPDCNGSGKRGKKMIKVESKVQCYEIVGTVG